METFSLKTRHREELVDITGRVNEIVERLGIAEGMCWVSVPHTTAAVTVNEGCDPDVAADIVAALGRIVPRSAGYAHAEGNSDAHVKATLVGSCQPVPIENGRLALGQWQALLFCEFDGPRTREVRVKTVAG